jgi:bacteriocin-like protein
MSKITLRNVKASVEVREVKDELSEAELNSVSGGKIRMQDVHFVKRCDKASAL